MAEEYQGKMEDRLDAILNPRWSTSKRIMLGTIGFLVVLSIFLLGWVVRDMTRSVTSDRTTAEVYEPDQSYSSLKLHDMWRSFDEANQRAMCEGYANLGRGEWTRITEDYLDMDLNYRSITLFIADRCGL